MGWLSFFARPPSQTWPIDIALGACVGLVWFLVGELAKKRKTK